MRKSKNSTACKFRIGSNIRKWRNIKDIKQKDLAAALQISEAAISNIENDITNISVGQLEEISVVLNVSMEQLLSDPLEKFRSPVSPAHSANEKEEQPTLDKELIHAIISSLEKKDQQMQLIMQNFLRTVALFMEKEKFIIPASKQAESRA